MRKISLLLFLLSINLSAFMSETIKKNYEKARKTFSKEDYDLINKRLDNYGFINEYGKSELFANASEIRGNLRKIGIKEYSVLLDALDAVGYLIKSKITTDAIFLIIININNLIEGYPGSVFNYLIQLDSDKIDYVEKYGDEARDNFRKSYKKDKITTVKQILKQILADLPKD
uniref:EppA n=1 Tax=Borreliella burgdorferi TaxID=139 RepID=Q840B1_BORBG|nr:EppA [Borreliella burgdorferi]